MKGLILKRVFYFLLFIIALGEIITVNILHLGHGYFWFEELPAFGSAYGLISSIVLIIVAKVILTRFVSKKEDYYD